MSSTLLNIGDCARCPALAASRRRIVHGYGDPQSRIIFIGEAPGRHGADQTGVPFSGDKSGRALQRILIALDLMDGPAPSDAPRLRCFVTNAVRCCPASNRTPTTAEPAACAPYLWRELDALDPLIIVPVGLVALRAVGVRYLGTAPAAIRTIHAVPLGAGERVIVPLVHPARIARAQIDAFVATMRAVLGRRREAGD
jgi:DNA polymerase